LNPIHKNLRWKTSQGAAIVHLDIFISIFAVGDVARWHIRSTARISAAFSNELRGLIDDAGAAQEALKLSNAAFH